VNLNPAKCKYCGGQSEVRSSGNKTSEEIKGETETQENRGKIGKKPGGPALNKASVPSGSSFQGARRSKNQVVSDTLSRKPVLSQGLPFPIYRVK